MILDSKHHTQDKLHHTKLVMALELQKHYKHRYHEELSIFLGHKLAEYL